MKYKDIVTADEDAYLKEYIQNIFYNEKDNLTEEQIKLIKDTVGFKKYYFKNKLKELKEIIILNIKK